MLETKLKIYDRMLATITAIGVISGGVWGIFTYFKQQDQSIQLRQRELAFMVYQEKKEAYLSLIDAAGEITASRNRQEVVAKAPIFLKLYYGRAHVIADAAPEVSQEKRFFKDQLMAYLKDEEISQSPFEYFGNAAYALTDACKIHIDPRTLDTIQPAQP